MTSRRTITTSVYNPKDFSLHESFLLDSKQTAEVLKTLFDMTDTTDYGLPALVMYQASNTRFTVTVESNKEV